MKILSVNLGKPVPIQLGKEAVQTGIFKEPHHGPVRLERLGVEGDAVVDAQNHGGPDQAVYLYSQEDYNWWSERMGRAISPGTFGENLTLSTFGTSPLKIGDRLRIGEALLEVTAPRIPCAKLDVRMGEAGFVKRFAAAQRPGAYVRVLQPGIVQAGDPVELAPAPEDYPSVVELFNFWYVKEKSLAEIERHLRAPVAARAAAALRRWRWEED